MTSSCEFCKNKFNQKRPRQPSRFCSRKCSAIARDKNTIKGKFTHGKSPWNKGLAGFMAGRKASKETRIKQSKSLSGANAPNWRGGISSENECQRKQARYRFWRISVFERDHYTCQHCGDRSAVGHRVVLNADHIKPFSSYPDLRFELSNGRTLCVVCHRKTPTYGACKTAELTNGPT